MARQNHDSTCEAGPFGGPRAGRRRTRGQHHHLNLRSGDQDAAKRVIKAAKSLITTRNGCSASRTGDHEAAKRVITMTRSVHQFHAFEPWPRVDGEATRAHRSSRRCSWAASGAGVSRSLPARRPHRGHWASSRPGPARAPLALSGTVGGLVRSSAQALTLQLTPLVGRQLLDTIVSVKLGTKDAAYSMPRAIETQGSVTGPS
jgi:hypothetical protein